MAKVHLSVSQETIGPPKVFSRSPREGPSVVCPQGGSGAVDVPRPHSSLMECRIMPRREFLSGAAGMIASIGLAGCSGLPIAESVVPPPVTAATKEPSSRLGDTFPFANIEGGWRLSALSGVTASANKLMSWASSGTLAPGFVVKGGSITIDSNGDLAFPGDASSFIYQSLPIPHSDAQTLFGLIRIDSPPRTSGVLMGKYLTKEGKRSWQITCESDGVWYLASSPGTTIPTAKIGPQEPAGSYVYFVIRKNGGALDSWWNGIAAPGVKTVESLLISEDPICIGGRSGNSATDSTSPFVGRIRELGYFDRPLLDHQIDALLDWLSTRMRPALSWGQEAKSGPYTVVPKPFHSTVITPNGAAPAENAYYSHRYHHHTRIAVHRERVWVACSSSGTNEDAGGQMTIVMSSTDDGARWDKPLQVVAPQSQWNGNGASYVRGSRISYPRCFVKQNEALYIVAAIDTVNTTNNLIGAALVAAECRSDGTIGPLFRISSAAYSPLPGFSAIDYEDQPGLMRNASLFGTWGGSSPENIASPWPGWISYNGQSFAEPSTCQLDDDGVNFLRTWRRITSPDKHVYASISSDGGSNFGPLFRTGIPDSPSPAASLRLRDGRVALVGNPVDSGSLRDPLYLALFDGKYGALQRLLAVRQRIPAVPKYPGSYKGGGASYADLTEGSGKLYLSYSMQKETIGFTRIEIP